MAINIIGKKINVSDSLRAYAEEKISAALKVMDWNSKGVDVVLFREKNQANPRPACCEVTLRYKDKIIRVEEYEEDLHAAIDVAAAKLSRQLRKFKTRVIDKRIQQSADVAADARRVTEEAPLDLDKLMDEVADDNIVREKDLELEPLTTDEALLQMDLLGHDFFVFLDRDTSNVHVLYRRKDGGYGLLRTKA